MLEGYPNSRSNSRRLKNLRERLEKVLRHPPYLIAPMEVEVEQEYFPPRLAPWVEFPGVQCTAHFKSSSLGEFGSSLCVVWFQREFAFPVDPNVIIELTNLDWAKYARPHDDF